MLVSFGWISTLTPVGRLYASMARQLSTSGSWTRTNSGGGGAFTAVGDGPTGLMVVGSDLNNYRHYLRDLAIFPLDNRGLFVTSCSSNCCGGDPTHSHGVLRSVDGGATWTQVNLCRIGIAQRGNR